MTDSEFQFPTRWNSTMVDFSEFVSISRFNSQRDGILPLLIADLHAIKRFQFPTGWNSTRFFRGLRWNSFVSIPNGMEFYRSRVYNDTYVWCFNSQRDGILPERRLRYLTLAKFQFPTGWNSTRGSDSQDRAAHCFNSQRDGILRFSANEKLYYG